MILKESSAQVNEIEVFCGNYVTKYVTTLFPCLLQQILFADFLFAPHLPG